MLPDDVNGAAAVGHAALEVLYPAEFQVADAAARAEQTRRARLRVGHLHDQDPEGAWVAELDGEIVGVALALVREGIWGLSLFGVKPGLQGQGIGGRLLEERCAPPRAAVARSSSARLIRALLRPLLPPRTSVSGPCPWRRRASTAHGSWWPAGTSGRPRRRPRDDRRRLAPRPRRVARAGHPDAAGHRPSAAGDPRPRLGRGARRMARGRGRRRRGRGDRPDVVGPGHWRSRRARPHRLHHPGQRLGRRPRAGRRPVAHARRPDLRARRARPAGPPTCPAGRTCEAASRHARRYPGDRWPRPPL